MMKILTVAVVVTALCSRAASAGTGFSLTSKEIDPLVKKTAGREAALSVPRAGRSAWGGVRYEVFVPRPWTDEENVAAALRESLAPDLLKERRSFDSGLARFRLKRRNYTVWLEMAGLPLGEQYEKLKEAISEKERVEAENE